MCSLASHLELTSFREGKERPFPVCVCVCVCVSVSLQCIITARPCANVLNVNCFTAHFFCLPACLPLLTEINQQLTSSSSHGSLPDRQASGASAPPASVFQAAMQASPQSTAVNFLIYTNCRSLLVLLAKRPAALPLPFSRSVVFLVVEKPCQAI